MLRIVGLALVRNEERFVERAIRNVASFCDEIYAVDHMSEDATWDILRQLASDLPHLRISRSRNAAAAHAKIEGLAGTETWVLGVDGDELYDPAGLARLRPDLLAGAHQDVFRLKVHVLNCDELDEGSGVASGWMAPPSRPVTKLFNLGAVRSWRDCPDPLQGGRVAFKDGYSWESRRDLAAEVCWDDDPLRLLHVCFLPRSSREGGGERLNLDETREFDRSVFGRMKRLLRPPRPAPHIERLRREGRSWKREWYARGPRVTIDARPFLRVW